MLHSEVLEDIKNKQETIDNLKSYRYYDDIIFEALESIDSLINTYHDNYFDYDYNYLYKVLYGNCMYLYELKILHKFNIGLEHIDDFDLDFIDKIINYIEKDLKYIYEYIYYHFNIKTIKEFIDICNDLKIKIESLNIIFVKYYNILPDFEEV